MGGGDFARQPVEDYYCGQGGWDGYTWGGVFRYHFVFSDSLEVGGYLVPDCGEGGMPDHQFSAADLAAEIANKYLAGIVCVADQCGGK